MNDTTSPPEESDDRAGVATGQQAASNDPAPAEAASSADATPPAGSAGNGAAEQQAAGQPDPADGGNGQDGASDVDAPTAQIRLPQANGSAPATMNAMPVSSPGAVPAPPAESSAAAPGARPGTDSPDVEATDRGAVAGSANGSVVDDVDSSAPTVSTPIPVTSGGAPKQTGPMSRGSSAGGGDFAGADRSTAEPRTPSVATESVPAPTATRSPATGPIPTPGPAAANPPPWNRVPGRTPQPAEQHPPAPQPTGPAGGLLDGPTAYLMPDSGPATDVTEPPVKSWSPMRAGRTRPPRRAALQLKRLDPWSMLKLGLVLAVVIFFIWLVAVGVLYGVLDGMGVWDRLNGTYADLVSGEAPTGSPLISAGRVFGLAAVIGAINSLLFAVAVTIGAFVYNVSADLVGGVEVTLSERD